MANNKTSKLDEGFEEVEIPDLDEGFEETSVDPASKMDTAIGQGLQGATFGFGDEITSNLAAATDIATGDSKLADYKKLYNQYLESERAQLKKEQADNPKTALAANVGGSLLTLRGSVLNPVLKGATKLQAAGKLALAGATGGALTSAGISEADNALDLGQDIFAGGLTGTVAAPVVGGSLAGGAKLVSKASDAALPYLGKMLSPLAKIPIVDDAVSAAQGAAQGKTYTGNTDTYQDMLRDAGSDTVQVLKDLANAKFANKNQALKEATESGLLADLTSKIDDTLSKVESLPANTKEQIKAKKELLRFLTKSKENTIKSPEEIEKFVREIQEVADVAMGAPSAQKLSSSLKSDTKTQLGELVPNLPELNKESHDVIELMKRLTGKEPGDIRPGMDESATAAIKDRVTNILKKAENSPAKLEDIIEGFEGVGGLNKYAPEKAKTIQNTVQTINDDLRLANIANKTSPNYEGGLAKSIVGNAQTAAVKIGEQVGKSMPGLVNKISGMKPEQLKMLSEKAMLKYGKDAEAMARVLENASTKPSQTRNAIIFGMMQRPEYREKLNQLHDDEEPKE